MFGEVVTHVESFWFPMNVDLLECLVILEPVVSHIDGLGLVLLNCRLGEGCYFIVSLDGSWWLRVTKISEKVSDGNNFLGVVEKGSNFSFG